jgi:hypothetical protein
MEQLIQSPGRLRRAVQHLTLRGTLSLLVAFVLSVAAFSVLFGAAMDMAAGLVLVVGLFIASYLFFRHGIDRVWPEGNNDRD